MIISYNHEKEFINKLLFLIDDLYHNSPYLDIYRKSIIDSLSDGNPFYKIGEIKNFLAIDNNKSKGHISAIIDPRLSQENEKIGLIGFFETINDIKVSDLLLNTAIDWLRKKEIDLVRGPINLTIWGRYRFLENNFNDIFLTEPFNPGYYNNFFQLFGFKETAKYCSGRRSDFKTILPFVKKGYESVLIKGFKIRVIDTSNLEKELSIIHQLSLKIFRDSWSFVPISFDEFHFLYKDFKNIIKPNFIDFILDGDNEVGFCFSMPDMFFKKHKRVILKTIGILPEYQGKNLGSALIYSQHLKAQQENFKEFIYALVYMDSVISKMTYPGAEIFHYYKAYEYQL